MQQYRLTNQLTATTPTEIQLLKVDEENLLLLCTGSLNPSPQIINYIIIIITVHSQFELLYGIQNQSTVLSYILGYYNIHNSIGKMQHVHQHSCL